MIPKMRRILFVGLVSFSFLGCSQYIEQPTPPGQIAPPIPPVQGQPYRNPYAKVTPPPASVQQPAVQAQASPQPATSAAPLFSDAIMYEFEDIYHRSGAKRIAIFLNRALSDEVREWKTDKRAVISAQGTTTIKHGETTHTYTGPGGISTYTQRHSDITGRESPGESWMWQFEEGFLEPFLSIGAKIVDRATIMRLTAAKSGRQGSTYNPMAVKKIEMDSLLGKADLFVEILIRRSSTSEIGYEFKAQAKEVKTGIIRANVTSVNWQYGSSKKTERVVATETGYKFVEEVEETFPELSVVARDLSLALMKSLSRAWDRHGGSGKSG